ncbi:unnamed protein product [Darwinula stevensoni]|uniref:PIPK domain-containing protein n=1 Tax=Darwinula stevensoni TaxID=69355 RepID=A0A7R8X8R6_9CRUS|nr:unnamed protein product [Darwinula stevensoni]CAG0884756.1 unnamed protein product [Darwinula stevensoni]
MGEGSTHTPAHHYGDYKFKTYAALAFRYFRDLFGIQPDDFLLSMCNAPLRELSNPGASGSIFYLTEDDEFIIKTVQHKEGEFLQKLLPGYFMNLNQNPRTLLPKFFGLYCYQCNSKNVRLAVMNNLLPSSITYHQKYDLKGSTYKRRASKHERIKASPTFKDLDFIEHHPEGLMLEADTYNALMKTMQRDCRVLESFKIMDYSLLVGIHNLDQAAKDRASRSKTLNHSQAPPFDGEVGGDGGPSGDAMELVSPLSPPYTSLPPALEGETHERLPLNLVRSKSMNRQRLVAHSTAMESIQAESEPIDEDESLPPGGIPARNAKGERLLLFLGVIDILQSYRLKKKLEHTWKAMIHDGDSVSVHRPSFYAQRFLDFMSKKVFKKIPSPLKHSPSKRKNMSLRHYALASTDSGEGGPSDIPTNSEKCPGSNIQAGGGGVMSPVAKTFPPILQDRVPQSLTQSQSTQMKDPTSILPSHTHQTASALISRSMTPSSSRVPPPVPPRFPRSSARTVNRAETLGPSSPNRRLGPDSGSPIFRGHTLQHVYHGEQGGGRFEGSNEPISISQIQLESKWDSTSTTSGIGSTLRTVTWTPPLSTDTPTWTEGTPSFTESSSSEGAPTTPHRRGVRLERKNECELETEEYGEEDEEKSVGQRAALIGVCVTGGAGILISIVAWPFVSPAFRRLCLPFVPATNSQVRNVLLALQHYPKNSSVVDLGSGDGRLVIEAAKKGYKATGIELNPWLVLYSQFLALKHGISKSHCHFKKGDLWKSNIGLYDAVIIFGVEEMMPQLEKKLVEELRNDGSVIACRFPLPNSVPLKIVGSGIDAVWLYSKKSLGKSLS